MTNHLQYIKACSAWIIKEFAADNCKLDYTIRSFIEIDRFFNINAKDGKPVKGGQLDDNFDLIIISLGSYIGETFIKNVKGAYWQTCDVDLQGEFKASVTFPNGVVLFPIKKVLKRFQYGSIDSIYFYGHFATKIYINEPFDQQYIDVANEESFRSERPWWKFW